MLGFIIFIIIISIYFPYEYFIKYPKWNGYSNFGQWEDCPCSSDTWDGQPGKHIWSRINQNYYGTYRKCILCNSIKTTNL